MAKERERDEENIDFPHLHLNGLVFQSKLMFVDFLFCLATHSYNQWIGAYTMHYYRAESIASVTEALEAVGVTASNDGDYTQNCVCTRRRRHPPKEYLAHSNVMRTARKRFNLFNVEHFLYRSVVLLLSYVNIALRVWKKEFS